MSSLCLKIILKIKKKINNFNQVAMSLFKTIVVSSVCYIATKKKKFINSISTSIMFFVSFFFSVVPSNDFSICHDIY